MCYVIKWPKINTIEILLKAFKAFIKPFEGAQSVKIKCNYFYSLQRDRDKKG